jgi:hypothetical protein
MLIEDVVGVKIGIENEVDMEDGNRGWNLEDIAGDSLRQDLNAGFATKRRSLQIICWSIAASRGKSGGEY